MSDKKEMKFPKWNWGAFFLTWIWGIGNNTYVSLLMFIPLVNLIMPFILGFNGYKWAWKNKNWGTKEEFLNNQKSWSKWGTIIIGGMIVLFIIMFSTLSMTLSKKEPLITAIHLIQQDEKCQEVLGENIKKGVGWSGSISVSGVSGNAEIGFTMKGSKSSAKCYLLANKRFGKWNIKILVAKDKKTGENILFIDNR